MRTSNRLVLSLFLLVLTGSQRCYAQDALRTLEQDLAVPVNPPAARAQQAGYLGMTVDLKAPEGKSVYVVSVVEGGPAARGGLKANDVISEINQRKIGNLQDLDQIVRQPPGSRLVFKVRRSNVPQRFEVVVGTRPGAPATSEQPSVDELPAPASSGPAADARTAVPGTNGTSVLQGSRPSLGIRVADVEELSDADRRRYGVAVDRGALISGLTEGAPAALAGLPLGGVVVSVNGRQIGTAQDIVDVVRSFRPGEQIEVTYWEGDRKGRKQVRVGRSTVAVKPPTTPDGAGPASGSRPLLQRRSGDRPLLNALERILDDVLPPASGLRGDTGGVPRTPSVAPGDSDVGDTASEPMTPPPPPSSTVDLPDVNIELPAADLPEPRADSEELEKLRKQAAGMQKTLELLLRRIEELEKKE